MKFRVKDVNISSGGILIAILHHHDARTLDLRVGDRILVKTAKHKVVCILDIAQHSSTVPRGQVGLFEEVLDRLRVRKGQHVEISYSGKPESVVHIKEKLNGKELCYKDFLHIMRDITNDSLTDIEKTYFVCAGYVQGWSKQEIVSMTKAMVDTGEKIKFSKMTLDKHCVGGVPGNRTTMVVIPIIAAAGFTIPKTSSRAITSPAGTADTMECLAKVELSEKKIKQIVKKTGACIVHGGSMNLAPADDKIIEVEHPLSIDAEGQLLASVMAKKYSVSANHVLIDIPYGKSTKSKTKKDAQHLKKQFSMIGNALGMNVKVIITDGSAPIGNGIGPLLEAEDVMAVLRCDPLAPQDLREKALSMAAVLLKMTGKFSKLSAKKRAKQLLDSGAAYKKMQEIIKAQGKQPKVLLGEHRHIIKATKVGKVREIDNEIIAKIARIAGAPDDKGAGLFLHKKVKDSVLKADKLYTVYAQSKTKMQLVKEFLRKNKGYTIK